MRTFSQQLSTFPTCTESAAILVFAFESNPTGSEEGRWDSKNKPCFTFPSLRTKRRGYFDQTIGHLGHTGLPMSSSRFFYASRAVLEGSRGWTGAHKLKKLKHETVPVQLEKEAVVTVEASAQRSSAAAAVLPLPLLRCCSQFSQDSEHTCDPKLHIGRPYFMLTPQNSVGHIPTWKSADSKL